MINRAATGSSGQLCFCNSWRWRCFIYFDCLPVTGQLVCLAFFIFNYLLVKPQHCWLLHCTHYLIHFEPKKIRQSLNAWASSINCSFTLYIFILEGSAGPGQSSTSKNLTRSLLGLHGADINIGSGIRCRAYSHRSPGILRALRVLNPYHCESSVACSGLWRSSSSLYPYSQTLLSENIRLSLFISLPSFLTFLHRIKYRVPLTFSFINLAE